MKHLAQFFFVLGLACLAGCASGPHRHSSAKCIGVAEALSMEHEEGFISVCGVLRYGFEDKNLYESQSAARDQSARKCISIGKASDFQDDLVRFDGNWVRVYGQVVRPFCPDGVICPAACSDIGIFVQEIQRE